MLNQHTGVLITKLRFSQRSVEPLNTQLMPLGISRICAVAAAVCGYFIGQGIAMRPVLEDMQLILLAQITVFLGNRQCTMGRQ